MRLVINVNFLNFCFEISWVRNVTVDRKINSGCFWSCIRSKSAMIGLPVEVKTPAMIRAEEIQSSLGCEFPSFVKPLVRSHVSSCFWMVIMTPLHFVALEFGIYCNVQCSSQAREFCVTNSLFCWQGLPVPFSRSHLPEKDTSVILEDESGEQFQVKYIQGRWGLSGGWRSFAMGHKLLEGDVLIFQLVESNKMKVTFEVVFIYFWWFSMYHVLNKWNPGDGLTIVLGVVPIVQYKIFLYIHKSRFIAFRTS